MTNTFKQQYDFELRLATMEEISKLVDFLAHKNWLDHEKQLTSISAKTKKLVADEFIPKNRESILKLLGGKVLVQIYEKYQVSIFEYSYIQEVEKGVISSLSFRALRNQFGFTLLEDEDVLFDLNELKDKLNNPNKLKSGRLRKPKAESIQKTLEIQRYFKNHPGMGIDTICREFGFSKTTYYRVLKWLAVRES